jgi:hypothetical protein
MQSVPITTNVVSSNLDQGEVYNIYVIKFVRDLRWFSLGPLVSSINETDRHDISEILLKVALNPSNKQTNRQKKPNTWGHTRYCTLCLLVIKSYKDVYLVFPTFENDRYLKQVTISGNILGDIFNSLLKI